MTLYEIDQALLACIDMETGEVDIEKYEQLAEEKDKKIENIACYYKALTAEAEAIKAEEKALAERRKVKENKAESLKKFLASVLRGNLLGRQALRRIARSNGQCSFSGCLGF